MVGEPQIDQGRALYERWRAFRPDEASVPDALTLAAYADARPGDVDAIAVELALAADPDLLGDVLAAREGVEPEIPSAAFLAEAGAAFAASRSAEIIPFRRSRAPRFSGLLGWGAVAASLLFVSLMGFGLGVEAQQTIDVSPANAGSVELFDLADSGIG
jgi:hypothetical protein